MTSKQRSYLIGLASRLDPVVQIGKSTLTPDVIKAAEEALEARELIKINVQKNCFDDLRELADHLSAQTHAETVKVIGRKIILFREARNPQNRHITLPQGDKK